MDDTYNANPSSLAAALDTLATLPGKKILVLGDMAETSFRQSMLISKGSLDIFVSTPLAGTITCLALVMLLWPALGFLKKLSRG